MNIFYTNETLVVNINDELTQNSVNIMQKRVFRIIEDYDIDNIILKNHGSNNNLLSPFVTAYKNKHNGNLRIM